MRNNQIDVTNLTLTSDNRLIESHKVRNKAKENKELQEKEIQGNYMEQEYKWITD